MIKEGSNNREVFLSLDNIEENSRRGIRQGFFRVGHLLERNLKKEIIRKNKTGRIYKNIRTRSGTRKRRHRASAPGETPAKLSGNYRKNVGFQIRGSESMDFGIRDGADYAEFLEGGTKNMDPRPGVGNTVRDTEKDTQRFFESSLASELQ